MISTWTKKNLLLLFHIVNVEKDDLALTVPSLRLLHLLWGEKDGQEFFHVTSVSSGVITINVFS